MLEVSNPFAESLFLHFCGWVCVLAVVMKLGPAWGCLSHLELGHCGQTVLPILVWTIMGMLALSVCVCVCLVVTYKGEASGLL